MRFSEWLILKEIGAVKGQPINNGMFQANGARSNLSAVEALPEPSGFNPECMFKGETCKKQKMKTK